MLNLNLENTKRLDALIPITLYSSASHQWARTSTVVQVLQETHWATGN